MISILVAAGLGVVAGMGAFNKVADAWAMMVHGQVRVIQHREPGKGRGSRVPKADASQAN